MIGQNCRIGRTTRISVAGMVAVIGLAIISVPAFGVEWYVDNVQGNDAFNGRSASFQGDSGPFRSIARALRAARAGDRVILTKTPQPYYESITLQGGNHSGVGRAPFAIVGNGAILDGRRRVPVGAWEFVKGHVFRFRPERMSFQTLYVGEELAERVAVDAGATALPELQPRQWCLHHGWIYFCVEKGNLPSDYDLYYGGEAVGITLYEVRNVIVMDLTVRGFQLDGVNAHDGAREVLLASVHAEGNGRSGFSAGGASRVSLWQCSAKGNGVVQLRAEAYAQVSTKDCQIADDDNTASKTEGHAIIDGLTR